MVETELPKNNAQNVVENRRIANGSQTPSPSNTTPQNDAKTKTKTISVDSEIPPIVAILDEALLDNSNNDSVVYANIIPNNITPDSSYRVYKWRWYVLTVVALLNCLNALSWICYAPVANVVDRFYGKDTTNYLTVVFLVAAIPVGLFAMWSVRRFGVRSAILAAAWLNGSGSIIRLVSSLGFMSENVSQIVVIMGQAIAACAYPFIMFLPTKVAAAWFPDSQRTIANTIGTMSNPLGVLVAMLLSPRMVNQVADVLYLNILVCICCVVATLMATFGIRSSAPPTPPTRGAAEASMQFFAGIKKLVKSRSYIILFIALGAGIGMFNALYGMMQQILCARGYSNEFAGYCCVSMIVGGFAGAFTSGFLADKYKKFEEIMKIAFAIAVLGGIAFTICALRSNFAIPIAIFCIMFGFFGLAAYPIGMEMSVECSFPVAETTSAGLIVLSGQIQGSVFIIGMQFLRSELTGPDVNIETCANGDPNSIVKAYDMTMPLIVFCSVATVIISFFIIAFRPKLRRLKLEQETARQAKSLAHKQHPEDKEMVNLRAQRANVPNSPLA